MTLLLCALLAVLSCQKDPSSGSGTSVSDFSIRAALPSGGGKAVWHDGDQMAGYSIADGKILSTFTLEALESGASTASFKAVSSLKTGSEYRFIYPKSASGRAIATVAFATAPVAQTALADGIDDGAFLAYAHTADAGAPVSFTPVLSRVSFSLAGSSASSVTMATLTATGGETLAGPVRILESGGSLSVAADPFSSSVPTAVTLSGAFEAGKEYSFSVIPGKVEELVLTLRDDEARVYQQTIDARTLEVGAKTSLGTLTPVFEGSHDWTVYQRATREGIHPLVLVFTPEGFTESRRDEYIDACRAAADHIFSVEPFKHFQDYFSVYIGWEAAKVQGVGSPWNVPLYTDANGNKSFNSMGQNGRDVVYSWIAERCPEVMSGRTSLNDVGVIMLIDTKDEDVGAVCDWDISAEQMGRFVALVSYAPGKVYGSQPAGKIPQTYGATGVGRYEGGDGGTTVTLTNAELEELGYKTTYGSTRAYLNDYRGTILHEGMGHGFTHLMDEYWIYYNPGYTYPDGHWYTNLTTAYHTLSFPAGLNLSPSLSDAPWRNLMSMRSELIAKDQRYERISACQGGLVQYMWGIWRPERVSVMMDCRPYFSTWQRALVYQRIMRSSGENPSCDVRNNEADLRAYMDIDLMIGGINDPVRDN